MRKRLLILVLVFTAISNAGASDRNILQKEASNIDLEGLLNQEIDLHQFPRYDNREFWDNVAQNVSVHYIEGAEQYLDFSWPAIKATDYLEIMRTGNRLHDEFVHPHNVLRTLIIAELLEGNGRFLDQIVNGVWYYSEQTWWGWSAHLKDQKEADGLPDVNEPILELGASEVANTLVMSYHLFKDAFDQIHPFISKRLKAEVMHKVIVPFYERDDFWWMGFIDWYDPYADSPRRLNNWNTWINYNVLLSILILEEDGNKRINGVSKVLRSMDKLINSYPEDGGCDEGPNYWGRAGGSMYRSLRLLESVTDGQFNVFNNQLIRNMGTYIYKASINYPYFINFADADATSSSYPDIIYLFGKDINDPVMQAYGAYIAHKEGWQNKPLSGNIDRQVTQLLYYDEILNATAKNPLVSDFWLPNTELAGARDKGGSEKGFYFAAKGGYNDESHNHNDVGSFVLYYNGKPCMIDVGRETYTAETFGPNRYDLWNMQSQYHNLPRIKGVDQAYGAQYKAENTCFVANSEGVVFTTNIAKAYPKSAEVKSWRRTYTLNRGQNFFIEDDFLLGGNESQSTTHNLISYCQVTMIEKGVLELAGEDFILQLTYDHDKLTPEIEFMEITDPRLTQFWPKGITRVVFSYNSQVKSDKNIFEIKLAS